MNIESHQVVAHRGYQRHYPENTLLSIVEAIKAGALHIELDIQLSLDQVPMIYHDETLERVSGFHGQVHLLSAAELMVFSAHEPMRLGDKFISEKISILSQLVPIVRANPQVRFYIELKEEAVKHHGAKICLTKIFEVLQPVADQCILISFDQAALSQAKNAGFSQVGLVTRDWKNREKDIASLRACVLFINKKRLPKGELVQTSCPVVAYEIDNIEEAADLLARGVDKVESYAVGELLKGR